jgi:hypothetical protein
VYCYMFFCLLLHESLGGYLLLHESVSHESESVVQEGDGVGAYA